MYNYQQLFTRFKINSIKDVNDIFWNEVAYEWADLYRAMGQHGTVTIQNFWGFTYIIDDGNQVEYFKDNPEVEFLESRIAGAFGISKEKAKTENRKIMRKWIGPSSVIFKDFGDNYDKGHFIAHGMGGPVDVNLFPQKREINQGWSKKGVVFRDMEKYITANPGTFVFARPIYCDNSFCPEKLEYGYIDKELNLMVEEFPNR